jgi:hypothetical protein
MREHRPLREARRARGVEEPSEVVRVHGEPATCGRARPPGARSRGGAWDGMSPARRPRRGAGCTPAVEHALSRLPAPVRDLVHAQCYILGVGARLRGWTSAPLATAGLYPIQVSGREFDGIVNVVAHEAAGHRWHASALLADVTDVTAPTEREHAEFLAYAAREGWPISEHEGRVAENERLAELCALAWSVA